MVIRGGGENSIIIQGNSDINSIILAKNHGKLRIINEDNSQIGVIDVDEDSSDIIMKGKIDYLNINASKIVITIQDATIHNLNVSGEANLILVEDNSLVNHLIINEMGRNVEIFVTGKIDLVSTDGFNTMIRGLGRVEKAEIKENANDSKIETENTEIRVYQYVTGVTGIGGNPIKGGSTINSGVVPSKPIGGGGGGSDSGNNGNNGNSGNNGDDEDNEDDEDDEEDEDDGTSVLRVHHISINESRIELTIGESETLVPVISPSNATHQIISWSTGDPEIAMVKDGKVTAKRKGTTTITAIADGKSLEIPPI